MLKSAQLYTDQINEKLIAGWYDLENQYYSCCVGTGMYEPDSHNGNVHAFASVDENDNVIGYIKYRVNWVALSATDFEIISFDKGNLIFIQDLSQVIHDIFEKYNLNRMDWICIADNPAMRGYRNFINKYGGSECGYYREAERLLDGKLHDYVVFELMKREFEESKNSSK